MARVALSGKTIAALAKPFHGGGGPSHSTIRMIWASAGAEDYLGEGNKMDLVLGGLRALQGGRRAGAGLPAVPADQEKLRVVVYELATRLLAGDFVDERAVAEALDFADVDPDKSAGTSEPAVESSAEVSGVSVIGALRTEEAEDSHAVMVVHGRDGSAKKAMFDWLRAIGLRPQEWSQLVKASSAASPFIGEILATAFTKAQAVVVLFTPDERVQLRIEVVKGASWRLQARPNVLFEAGMAFATHPTRTVIAVLGDQELPTDLAGRDYVRIESAGQLRDLAQRLEQAGCPVDLSGNDWLDIDRFPDRSGISAAPIA
jgi:predicted nucleotide-binding protein